MWSRWSYALFFLYGFAVAAQPEVLAAIRRLRRSVAMLALGLCVVSATLKVVADGRVADPFTSSDAISALFRATFAVTGWCCLVAILGFAQRPARERPGSGDSDPGRWRRFGAWGNEVALALYVVHQPVIVAIAFTVVTWNAPMLLKYLVIVTSSFVSCVALYQWLIRPFRTPRFLFGMTPRVPGVPVKGAGAALRRPIPRRGSPTIQSSRVVGGLALAPHRPDALSPASR